MSMEPFRADGWSTTGRSCVSKKAPSSRRVDEGIILYHLKILIDDRYCGGEAGRSSCGRYALLNGERTMAGHDFLDSIRDERVWTETLKKIGGAIGTASMSAFAQIAAGISVKLLS